MSGDHLILEGKVLIVNRDKFTVDCGGAAPVLATVCGKMRKKNIRVLVGDAVTVKVSPYDVTKGFIIYRKS